MTLLESIRNLLAAAGIEPAYIDPIPAHVNLAVRVRGPYMNEPVGDFVQLQRHRYQCYARAPTQNEAEALAQRCYKTLADNHPSGDTDTSALVPIQAPTMLGTDEQGRFEYVFNFRVVCWPEKEEEV